MAATATQKLFVRPRIASMTALSGSVLRHSIEVMRSGGPFREQMALVEHHYLESLMKSADAATIVEQDGRSHGIWYGDDCIAAIVAAFVADPDAELDTSCAAAGPEVDWARP